MSPLVVAGVVLVGALAVSGLGLLVLQVITVRNGSLDQAPAAPALRITIALAAALVAAIVISQAFGGAGGSFAAAGQQRYISAPVVYGSFGLIALATTRHFAPRWPLWTVGLLLITLLSTLCSPFAGPRFTVSTLVQGLVLFGGTALFGVCGLLDAEWSSTQRRRLLQLLLGVGAVAGLLGLGTGIFSALVLPSAATLVYLVRERTRWWPVWCAIGLYLIFLSVRANADAIDPSAASTGQLAVAAGILGLAALPRSLRLPLVVLGVVVGVVGVLGSDVPGLFIGRGAELDDVTLAQRAYETQQVVREISGNPVTLLFGAGPGATVDLSLSPDAITLAGSGRVLAAVPSVHLLSSYLLMKCGLLGLAWLGVFLSAAVSAAFRILSARRPDLFDLVLITLVCCGIIQAVPAATFLLSNPLPALLLAILHVRRVRAEDGAPGSIRTSVALRPTAPGPRRPASPPGSLRPASVDDQGRTMRP